MKITVSDSIFINRPPEAVWDFTQDCYKWPEWDRLINGADLIQTNPKKVDIRGRGKLVAQLDYVLNERPLKSSWQMVNIISPLFTEAESSWSYTQVDGGTLWSQNKTYTIKDSLFTWLFSPLTVLTFRSTTKLGMRKVKNMLENGTY